MNVPREIGNALVALLRAHLLGPSALVEIAVCLSKAGYSRREIVTFFYLVSMELQSAGSDEELDVIGDLNHHIAGDQCPMDQIIRLHDDPTDPVELASAVNREMKGWTPPTGWHE